MAMADRARYLVSLWDPESSHLIGPYFTMHELPVPGLYFEHDAEQWRVTRVVLSVPRRDGEIVDSASCVVVLDSRWNDKIERWESVESEQPEA